MDNILFYQQQGFLEEPPKKYYDEHYIYLRKNIKENGDQGFSCQTLQINTPTEEDVTSDFNTLWNKYYPLTEEGQKISQDLALADLAETIISQEV